MLTKILLASAALFAVFLVIVALQPSAFRITRSATMVASPEVIFAQVNDFHKWEDWSPWAKLDPASRETFDGPPAGVGAGFAWSGNMEVGEGRMTITENRAPELILLKLDFVRPMKATHFTEFVLQPQGNQTLVTWTMSGNNNFMAKAVNLFMNCDRIVGGFFEKGLAQMKAVVEAAPQDRLTITIRP